MSRAHVWHSWHWRVMPGLDFRPHSSPLCGASSCDKLHSHMFGFCFHLQSCLSEEVSGGGPAHGYMHAHTCIAAHVYTWYTATYMHLHICLHTYTLGTLPQTCMHTHTPAHVYTWYTATYMHAHRYTHTCTRIYMAHCHIHVYTRTQSRRKSLQAYREALEWSD